MAPIPLLRSDRTSAPVRIHAHFPGRVAPVMRRRAVPRSLLAACLMLLASACQEQDSAPRPDETPRETAATEAGPTGEGRAFERALAFTTLEGTVEDPEAGASSGAPAGADGAASDSALVVPLLFTARSTSDGVLREARGWVGRVGTWESFVDEAWRAGPSSTPWRIVPRGPLRLVVGEGGAVETVIFQDPPRVLELDLGEQLAEWRGPEGSSYRLESTRALLGSRAFEGITLDLVRARDLPGPPWGDWAFLVSGDSLQLVLDSPEQRPPGEEGAFRAYGRIDSRELQWPDVTVEWTESRAFEAARRDVPGAWRFRARGADLSGSFRARSAQLGAGDGEGPVLPVDAFFTVSGSVLLDGREIPVRGLYRHRRE